MPIKYTADTWPPTSAYQHDYLFEAVRPLWEKRGWLKKPTYVPGYWEDPWRVARYRSSIKNRPPGTPPPPHTDQIEQAYQYFKLRNNNKPWYSWSHLDEEDAGRSLLQSIPMPEGDMLWPSEQDYVTREQAKGLPPPLPDAPTTEQPITGQQSINPVTGQPLGGTTKYVTPTGKELTEEDYQALPWSQQKLLTIMQSPPASGAAIGALAGATGFAMLGGAAGTAVAGPVGTLVGAGVAGAIGAGLGATIGFVAEKNPALAEKLMWMDYPAEWVERGLGTGYLMLTAEDANAFADVVKNLPKAWQASHLFYEAAQPAFLKIGEPEAEPYGVLSANLRGENVPWTIYERIRRGETPEKVYADMSSKLGESAILADLVGHIILDPWNVTGFVFNDAIGIAGRVTKNKTLVTAAQVGRQPVKSLQLYGKMVSMSEDISNYGRISRWLAGIDAAGEPRILKVPKPPGKISKVAAGGVLTAGGAVIGNYIGGPIGGLIGGATGIALGKYGGNYFFSLTPASRAAAVANDGALLFAGILERSARSGATVDDINRMVRTLANNPQDVARELSMGVINSPEGKILPMTTASFVDKVDNLATVFHSADEQRRMVDILADISGKTPAEVLNEISNSKNAQVLLAQFREAALERGDDIGNAIAQAIDEEQLTTDYLREIADIFTKDGIPLDADNYRAQLYGSYLEHVADWSAKWFSVEPESRIFRMAQLVKSAQSLVLLGLNPTYLANNAINNMVTMAARGVFGLRSADDIDAIWTRVGYSSERLRAGIGPIGAGETELLAPIKAKTIANDAIDTWNRTIRSKTKKIGIFSTMSMKMEQWSSGQAVTKGFLEAFTGLHKRGKGFDSLPTNLERMLKEINPDLPDLVYQAIEGGMNQTEIENTLWSGVTRRSFDSFIPEVAQAYGRTEADVRNMLSASGLYDALQDRLKTTDDLDNAAVHKVFDDLEENVNQYFDDLTKAELENAAEKAAQQVAGEGASAALDIYDKIELKEASRWLTNFIDWEEVYARADDMTAGQRNVVFSKQMRYESKQWQRFNALKTASYLGIGKALGLDNDVSRAYIGLLQDNIKTFDGFFKTRHDKLRKHFNTIYTDKKAANLAWQALEKELDDLYDITTKNEIQLATKMDDIFANLFEEHYGAGKGEAATKWRQGVRGIREKMIKDMRAHRAVVKNLTPDERRVAWTKFLDENYKVAIVERFTANIEGIRKLLGMEEPKPPTEPPPAKPPEAPPGPPKPPVAPAPAPAAPAAPAAVARIPVMITNDMKARLADLGYMPDEVRQMTPTDAWAMINENQRRVPTKAEVSVAEQAAQANLRRENALKKRAVQNIGEEFGIPETEGPHLLHTLRKSDYGGFPERGALEEFTPAEVKRILEKRKALKVKADAVAKAAAREVKVVRGGQTTALGMDPNNVYGFEYQVVDLDDLIPSHTDDLKRNIPYPEELQPRARERVASETQIDKIAKELRPDALLIETHRLDSGPMIIGPDMVVESGNGRILALRRARELYPDMYTNYIEQLRNNLDDYGIAADDIADMESPVLVRQRLDDVDRVAFTAEANEAMALRMSPYEQALQDAGLLTDEAVAAIQISETQSIEQALNSTTNRQVVRSFIGALTENERAALLDSKGNLNRIGLTRLKSALFAKTYPGEAGQRLLAAFTESIDPGIKNIENALFSSLPTMTKMEELIRSGYRAAGLSLAEDLSRTVDVYARVRQQAMKIDDYLTQQTFFESELNPTQLALLGYLSDNVRSSKRLRDFFQSYAKAVMEQVPEGQMEMIQGARLGKEDILRNAAKEIGDPRGRFTQEAEAAAIGAAGEGLEEPRAAEPEQPTETAEDFTGRQERARRAYEEETIREREQAAATLDEWEGTVRAGGETTELTLLPAGDIKKVVRDSFVEIFGYTDEMADAEIAIYDAVATQWAKDNNSIPSYWWQSRIAGVGRGAKEAIEGLDQRAIDVFQKGYIEAARKAYKDIGYKGAWVDDAVEIFGETLEAREAGWILDDGRMLDFSGKNEGGTAMWRAYDHRDIGQAIPDDLYEYSDVLTTWGYNTGSIRMNVGKRGEELSLSIYSTLGDGQRNTIDNILAQYPVRQVFVDVVSPEGYNIDNFSFRPAGSFEGVNQLSRHLRSIYRGVGEVRRPYGLDEIMFQSATRTADPIYYARSRQAIESFKGDSFTRPQLEQTLKKANVSKNEWYWMELEDLVEGVFEQTEKKGRVSKQVVLDGMRDPNDFLSETYYGESFPNPEDALRSRLLEDRRAVLLDEFNKLSAESANAVGAGSNEAKAEVRMIRSLYGGVNADIPWLKKNYPSVDWDRYWAVRNELSEIGGEVANINARARGNVAGDTKYEKYVTPGGKNQREILLFYNEQLGKRQATYPYTQGHYSGENLVAHARVNDRVIDGKRTLFVDEIQSDWHQGRIKDDYFTTEQQNKYIELKNRVDQFENEIIRRGGEEYLQSLDDIKPKYDAAEAELKAWLSEQMAPGDERRPWVAWETRTPLGPFTESWPNMMLSRVMRVAAERGYDQIAWTGGEIQIKRYTDMAQSIVQHIDWRKAEGGALDVKIVRKAGGDPIVLNGTTPDILGNYVGASVAKEIDEAAETSGRYMGEDIIIGGAGHRAFYDDRLVNIANKIGKRFGVKVAEDVDMITRQEKRWGVYMDGQFQRVFWDEARALDAIEGTPSYFGAEVREMIDAATEKVHILSFSDDLKNSSVEAYPLKFQGERGGVRFQDDGRAVIYAFQNPDASTGLHELAHIFQRDLGAEDLITSSEFVGAAWDEAAESYLWSKEHHEKFANAFERYCYDGIAPTIKLESVFAKIKGYMLAVYTKLTGTAIDIELSPEMKKVFDRILSGEAEEGQLKMFEEAEGFRLRGQRVEESIFKPQEEGAQPVMPGMEEAARSQLEFGGAKAKPPKLPLPIGKVSLEEWIKWARENHPDKTIRNTAKSKLVKTEGSGARITAEVYYKKYLNVDGPGPIVDEVISPVVPEPIGRRTTIKEMQRQHNQLGEEIQSMEGFDRRLDIVEQYPREDQVKLVEEYKQLRKDIIKLLKEQEAEDGAKALAGEEIPTGRAPEPEPRAAGEPATGGAEVSRGAGVPGRVGAGVRRTAQADLTRRAAPYLRDIERPPITYELTDPKVTSVLDENMGQATDARRILSAYDGGSQGYVLANGTGTGKTFVALGVIQESKPKKVLVVMPNRQLISQWKSVDSEFFKIGVNAGTKEIPSEGTWLTTYATMRSKANQLSGYDMIIFDESHNLKNYNSGQTQAAMNVINASPEARLLYMSATPYQSLPEMKYLEPLKLWDVTDDMGHDMWLAEHGYRYVDTEFGGFWKFDGTIDDILDVHRDMHEKGIASQRDLAMDVDLQNDFVGVNLTQQMRNTYTHVNTLFDQAKRNVSGQYKGMVEAQRTIAVRRIMEIQKVDEAIRMSKELGAEGRQVAIFTGYKSDLKPPQFKSRRMTHINPILAEIYSTVDTAEGQAITKLVEALGGEENVAQVHGDVSTKMRNIELRLYNEGKKKYLVATAASGGVGLSLHDTVGNAPRAQVNVYLPWSGQQFQQVAGRSYRYGSKTDVKQVWLFANTNKERKIARVVGGRLNEMGALVGGIDIDQDAKRMAAFDLDILDDFDADDTFFQGSQWFETDTGSKRVLYQDELGPEIPIQDGDGLVKKIPKNGDEPPAMGNVPPGSIDSLDPTPPIRDMSEQAWNEYANPVLRDIEHRMTQPDARVKQSVMNTPIDDATRNELNTYLHKTYGQMAETKLASIQWGLARRDAALLNYSKRYGWNNLADVLFPYHFWYTGTAMQWALNSIDKPSWMANWARLKNIENKATQQPGFPNRLQGKLKVPMPFLPDWVGGAYVDPLHQLFPMEQLAAPFDRYQEQKTQQEQRAAYVLEDMIGEEEITVEEGKAIWQVREGPLWDKAMQQAQMELDAELSHPMDLITVLAGLALPLDIIKKFTHGDEDKINLLPATRLIKSATAWVKPGGVNIEAPIRRAAGMPEEGQLGDFYIARELANMAAIMDRPAEEFQLAMVDKQGDLYEMAVDRIGKTQAIRNIGGALWLDFFPEGEYQQRELRQKFTKAIDDEDPEALAKFFDENPEYKARLMMGKWEDPDEMLRSLLVSQIWDAWRNKLPALHKKELQAEFGTVFDDAFLNKETRSYDAIDTETLTYWARQMGKETPETAPGTPQSGIVLPDEIPTKQYEVYANMRKELYPDHYELENLYYGLPEGPQREQFLDSFPRLEDYWDWKERYLADNPAIIKHAISEENKLFGAPPEVQELVYQYRTTRSQQFPGIFDIQEEYFNLSSTNQRKKFMKENPELEQYWDWMRTFMANYPETIPYIRSIDTLARDVLGPDYMEEYDIPQAKIPMEEFSSPLVSQLMQYYYVTNELGPGAMKELRRIWEKNGRPGATLQDYLDYILSEEFVTPTK